jgi:hypothetical protein
MVLDNPNIPELRWVANPLRMRFLDSVIRSSKYDLNTLLRFSRQLVGRVAHPLRHAKSGAFDVRLISDAWRTPRSLLHGTLNLGAAPFEV